MVNGGLTSPDLRSSRLMASLPVDRLGIEQPVGIDERQSRAALACLDLAIEARAPAGMAGGPLLLDPDPDRILIAIEPHLDHALGLPRSLTFAPQRIAGAAEIPGLPACDGLAQGFVVHVGDHQHVAG